MIDKRYQRNLGTLGEEGQRKLLGAHVTIVGAGGLGGSVFENLLRAGVGNITIIDHDKFEATNLNRQILSTSKNIGMRKASAALDRASEINPDVRVIAFDESLTDENATTILKGAHLVCDCVDSIKTRFMIERAANGLRIPMIHAAVAGSTGQLMTIFPGDSGLKAIYGDEAVAPQKGEEERLGTPPSTVAVIAAFQAHEAICIITGIQKPLRDELIRIDLDGWKMTRFKLRA